MSAAGGRHRSTTRRTIRARRPSNDPTRDIVGTLPLVFAEKSAALQVDAVHAGHRRSGRRAALHDPMYNSGSVPDDRSRAARRRAGEHDLRRDSFTLNGLPVGRPDGGVSPLVGRHPRELRRPHAAAARAPAQGTLSAGESAVVQFDLRVNDGVPRGTLISNQAVVASEELPDLLTDGDGNPATGPEPTVVVVGDAQQLRITKQVAVVGGGPARGRRHARVRGQRRQHRAVPAYVRRDHGRHRRAGAGLPHVRRPVGDDERLDGRHRVAGSLITADYSTTYGHCSRAVDRAAVPRRARMQNLADRHEGHEHRRPLMEQPSADRERERVDRRRRRRRASAL